LFLDIIDGLSQLGSIYLIGNFLVDFVSAVLAFFINLWTCGSVCLVEFLYLTICSAIVLLIFPLIGLLIATILFIWMEF
jgi:hypothetical protein